MVEGGPIDVLTGDYLAELTMLILWKAKQKDPSAGYARTVLGQLEQVLGHLPRPRASRSSTTPAASTRPVWPSELAALAERLGLHPKIAYVTGDDLLPDLDELLAAGTSWPTSTPAVPLAEAPAASR